MPLFKMKTKELAKSCHILPFCFCFCFLKHISEVQTTMSNEQYCYFMKFMSHKNINNASLKKIWIIVGRRNNFSVVE